MERKRSNVEMAALDTASGSRKWKRSSAPPDADAAIRGQMQHDPGMDDFADRDRDHRDRDRENCNVREQDRFMPIANVIRIMRKVLPMHAKISDDGKETIQECVSEFISFVTSEANDRCQREQRKTITAEDILWAMSKLGFDDYIDPLTFYLHKYREVEGDHRGSVRGDSLPKKEMNLHGLQPMMVQPNMFGGLSYYKDESNAPFTHDSYTVHK